MYLKLRNCAIWNAANFPRSGWAKCLNLAFKNFIVVRCDIVYSASSATLIHRPSVYVVQRVITATARWLHFGGICYSVGKAPIYWSNS